MSEVQGLKKETFIGEDEAQRSRMMCSFEEIIVFGKFCVCVCLCEG